ncbi:putative clathrin assembly protein At2g25430 [Gastrolobium bilobum]|uniref:putative clathrin assembly protein At2g25430 n=1 Tax=Gastrolobium bilobum TaxID=150636 RepID=UPI002AAF3338|nr:putative clathrin assembly protein At2g25430 [Gastrolobium bilobum]
MHRRFRQVCTALKEHSYVNFAKIASASGFSDINVIIIKATSPDDLPLHEKYIQQLLKLFSMSPSSCHSFAITFTRRFGTTRNWRVALKCLILLHRLLRSVPGNSTLWTELVWTRSNGLISLYPCHFSDYSSSSSISYTKFITSYAHVLDEALNCVVLEKEEAEEKEEEEAMHETFQEKMKEMCEILEMLPQLQSLIDRVMDCYPVGVAARSFIVQSAMKLILRDSFICYKKFRKEIVVVLDNLLQMPYRNCMAAFNIYKKAAMQTNQLYEFYEWCKAKGLCGFYEYPLVEPIPLIQIKALESFLSGMWQLTESSSSPTSSSSSSSEESFTEEEKKEKERKLVMRRDLVHIKGQEFEFEDEEEKPLIELHQHEHQHHAYPKVVGVGVEKPLIELEDDNDVNWETLLEYSVSLSPAYYEGDFSSFFSSKGWDNEHSFEDWKEGNEHADDKWRIVMYHPTPSYNPFSHPN